MSGLNPVTSNLAPYSPGATRISKTVNIPVKQEIRIQKREIRVPQVQVIEQINRVEKIKEIVRVVEKKVIVEEVKVVDQVYHPKQFRDIEVHVPVFEYIDQPITRTIVRYFAKDDTNNANVAAVEKRDEEGATLIKPNIKTYTVPIPVVNYRPIKKERVFVPYKEVPGDIVYKFIDAETKEELKVDPTQIVREPTKESVLRQLNSYVPARKVHEYIERPVPQAIPGPIQDVYVDDVAQILDPEVQAAYQRWLDGGKEGKVQLKRIEYEIEYKDVDMVVDGPVTSMVPDVRYEVVHKQIVEPVEKIEWVDVDEEEADTLGLPKHDEVSIVAQANDVIIINPVRGEVNVQVLPTIVETGPARFVVTDQVQKGEVSVEKQSFFFTVSEEKADVNLKILQNQNEISLAEGVCDGAVTAEEFEAQILAIQREVEERNQRELEEKMVSEHLQEAELIEQLGAQGLNFTDYLDPAGQEAHENFLVPAAQ